MSRVSTRVMPQGIQQGSQQVEGIQSPAGGGIDGAGRHTRRRRDSAHASSEIELRGMEFIERVDPEAEARSVRSQAAAAEHAESIVRGMNLNSPGARRAVPEEAPGRGQSGHGR
jgi:hypothetical protein